jgi:hypothetical protein
MESLRYFVSADGRIAYGPYADDEVKGPLFARKILGYPDREVWVVRAVSLEDARRKARSKINQETARTALARASDAVRKEKA